MSLVMQERLYMTSMVLQLYIITYWLNFIQLFTKFVNLLKSEKSLI